MAIYCLLLLTKLLGELSKEIRLSWGFRPLLNGSLIYFIRQHNLLKNYMPGIPPDLHRLRNALLECEQFESDRFP